MTTAIGVFGWSVSSRSGRAGGNAGVSSTSADHADLHEAAGATIRRVLSFEKHRAGEAAGKQRDDARNDAA
jgi:hypothetical protein